MTTKKKSAKPALGHILEPLRQFAVPLKSLKPDPLNTMSHDDRNIEEIMKSLSTFQQRSLLVVNAAGIIAKGNGTYEAAKRLGWTHIAAIRTDDREAIHAAYSIADNKTGQLGKFDLEALATQLKALEAEQVDLGITAFNMDEIAEVLASANRTIGQGDPDDIPEPREKVITRPGDIWQLGRHKIMCGDSLEKGDVKKVTGGGRIRLCITDPPFDMPSRMQAKGILGAGSTSVIVLGAGKTWFELLAMGEFRFRWDIVLRFGGQIRQMSWHAAGLKTHTRVALAEAEEETENAGHFTEQDKSGFDSGKWRKAIGESGSIIELGCMERKEHPHEKPVRLWKAFLAAFEDETIWEPFLGSGGMVIGGEMENKTIVGMEINPGMCDTIVRRWENFTGEKANRIDFKVK